MEELVARTYKTDKSPHVAETETERPDRSSSMDTTCVANRPLTSVVEEGRWLGVILTYAQSILLETTSTPKDC